MSRLLLALAATATVARAADAGLYGLRWV